MVAPKQLKLMGLAPVANVPQKAVHEGWLSRIHSAHYIDPFWVLKKRKGESSRTPKLVKSKSTLQSSGSKWCLQLHFGSFWFSWYELIVIALQNVNLDQFAKLCVSLCINPKRFEQRTQKIAGHKHTNCTGQSQPQTVLQLFKTKGALGTHKDLGPGQKAETCWISLLYQC